MKNSIIKKGQDVLLILVGTVLIVNFLFSCQNSGKDEEDGQVLVEQLYALLDKDYDQADSFLRENATETLLNRLKESYAYDCDDPKGCLDTPLLHFPEGSDTGDFVERQITSQGNTTYLISNKYEYVVYNVTLKLKKIDGKLKINELIIDY